MPASINAIALARRAAVAAQSKLAENVIAVDVSEWMPLTDIFLLASASNERQVFAIVDAIDEAMHEMGVTAIHKEGLANGRWVLLNYSEITVHIFHEEEREIYALDKKLRDCPLIELPEDTPPNPSEVQP